MVKTGTAINAHKVLVWPIVLGLMAWYSNWSTEAFVYLAMHGTYSLLWLAKQTIYPDRRFQERVPLWIGVTFVFLPLAGYYVAPWLLISRHVHVPPPLLGLFIATFILGVFCQYVSDAQKFYTLRLRPGLIRDGLFARTRNPNYLGEILIYVAYAGMSMHWLPFLVLGGWVFGFFVPNMVKKDRSMARHDGFAEYKAATGMLLPRLARPRARATPPSAETRSMATPGAATPRPSERHQDQGSA
jgi:protein-S-isoprenylcysteine O-methyltransferase Ste14